MNKISKNHKETEKIAKEFLNKLKPAKDKATVVGLYGDLGAGKTTFTQAVGKILKIKRKVNSPTFVIMKKYKITKLATSENFLANKTNPVFAGENLQKWPAFKYLFHMDAYRLKNEKELLHLAWDEIMDSKANLVFIEWPENIIKAIPKKHYKIKISHEKNNARKFEIKNP